MSDPDGNLVDDGRDPLVYLHGGYGGIFERVEQALAGKSAGAAVELKLQPEDAFGEYDAELVFVEALSRFPEGIEVGMQFERVSEEDDEERLFTITDIADGMVVIDGNHPLAGQALVFECVIVDVRAATLEELEHGHAHEPHGRRH